MTFALHDTAQYRPACSVLIMQLPNKILKTLRTLKVHDALPIHGIAANNLDLLSVRITHLMFSYSNKLGVTYQSNQELLVH